MKTAFEEYNKIVDSIPASIHKEVAMEIAVSNRIYELMQEKDCQRPSLPVRLVSVHVKLPSG